MTDSTTTKPSLDQRMAELDPAALEKALAVFKEHLTAEYVSYLNSCVHCGLCADSCHYYLADDEEANMPAHKVELITSVFKRYFTFLGKRFPGMVGARELDNRMIHDWIDSLFGRCSLCGRCTINCSVGLNIPYLIRAARNALSAIDLVPDGLQSTIDTALEKGNNMGIPKDGWLETVEWLEEELQDEVEDETATLPMDKQGARLLYTVNPREPMFFPMSISAVGKIFHAAGESWTFSSDNYDVTNYGLYADDKAGAVMSRRLVDSVRGLNCETMVLAECGHGFNANRWEGPEWLQEHYGMEVVSIIEVIAGYIRDGRIKLDKRLNPDRVTLHDPCNLVRFGGIIEEQRYILKHAVSDFVEMTPNRQQNYCCSGGGGQLAMTRFSERRISAGRIKADQIRATGAKIVVTPCHNCIDQLMELNKHYKLGIQIKTVSEMVADAIILDS